MVHIVKCSCQMLCMSSVLDKGYVEQGGKGCVSVFWAAEAFPAFSPLSTVD